MKAVPLGDNELEDYLTRFDEGIRDDFTLYLGSVEDTLVDGEGNEFSEEMKKDIAEELEKPLGIEHDGNVTIINVLGLVICDEEYFIYKGIDSRGNIEISDVNGDTGYLSSGKFFDPVEDAKDKELR